MPSLRDNSGAIAACNYEARSLKIRSGMPLSLAKKLASPQTVFINADKAHYEELSSKVFEIVDFFCEKVEQVSVDEAYLDLSSLGDFEKAEELCRKIKTRIKGELNLTCSVGLSTSKFLAKMASTVKKPDGFFLIKLSETDSFLAKQRVSSLPGVGPKTEEILKKKGINFVLDIKSFSKRDLIDWLGEANGSKIYDFSFGIDLRKVEPNREKQQLSRLMTMREDSRDYSFLVQNLDFLTDLLYKEINSLKKKFRTVSVIIVTVHMDTITRSKTFAQDINSADDLKESAHLLLRDFLAESESIVRRIGIKVSNFDEETGLQKKLFEF